jgi:hypothetical protein
MCLVTLVLQMELELLQLSKTHHQQQQQQQKLGRCMLRALMPQGCQQ